MKNLILGLGVCALLGAAVAFSRQAKPAKPEFAIASEVRNPWTGLQLNNDPEEFQFAVVSDRTGGHRAKIFSKAVEKLNLLQPEFVLSVGDLIEGGRKNEPQLKSEWDEFDSYVNRLKMPFFYVPGNHDVGNKNTDQFWQQRRGRRHYHFLYRDVLFLCLNTDDPPGAGAGHFSPEQIQYARDVLAANKKVRWTIVALHKPIWTAGAVTKTGWLEVEQALADRRYTVLCGHVHRYQHYQRNGRDYYQLATTGGGSKLRGLPYGEFDHIVWVTMKKTGPVMTNILLDSILPDDLKDFDSDEQGVRVAKMPTHPVKGKLFVDGVPAPGAYVVFELIPNKDQKSGRADAMVEADGSFVPSSYTAFDGLPAGEYRVGVSWRSPAFSPRGARGPNLLPGKYVDPKTSGLKATIKPGPNEVVIELKR